MNFGDNFNLSMVEAVREEEDNNILSYVEDIAVPIGFPSSSDLITKPYRVAIFKNKKKHKNIIVNLTTHRLCDAFLAGYISAKKKQIWTYTTGLKIASLRDLIFINEHLTNNEIILNLFKKAREAYREKNYKCY